MRVFSKAKFIEAEGEAVYLKCKGWVDEADGKRVVGGEVNGYASDRDWEVDDSLEQKAVEFAEKHGITSYEVRDGLMKYYEQSFDGYEWVVFKCIVNLDNMIESRDITDRWYVK